MAVEVFTSPVSTSTHQADGRKIIRTSNGTLWVVVHQATDTVPTLRYSTDDGATWATSSTPFAETINGNNSAWTFCSDGAIYLFYLVADSSEVRMRKGTLNGGHTDITWSAATTVATGNIIGIDLAVHEEGGSTYVHVVYATHAGLCDYKRWIWGASSGSPTVITTAGGATHPQIDFHHTLADVTAVKDSAPHIYVSWYEGNKVMFKKGVYSSGPSWAFNADRIITSDAKAGNTFAMSFDGTDVVIMADSLGTANAVIVLERDAADTTTTSLPNTPAKNGTGTPRSDVTYSPERDIEIIHSDQTAKVLQRVVYDRSGSAWGSWVTIDSGADDWFPQVKRGYWSGSKTDAVEVIWTDNTGAPYPILHERFEFAPPPSVAVGWGIIPIGG